MRQISTVNGQWDVARGSKIMSTLKNVSNNHLQYLVNRHPDATTNGSEIKRLQPHSQQSWLSVVKEQTGIYVHGRGQASILSQMKVLTAESQENTVAVAVVRVL